MQEKTIISNPAETCGVSVSPEGWGGFRSKEPKAAYCSRIIFRLACFTFSVRPPCHDHWMMSLLESTEMKLFQFCHFDLVLETRHRLNRHICHLHCLSSWAHLKRKNGTELALNLEGASDKLTSGLIKLVSSPYLSEKHRWSTGKQLGMLRGIVGRNYWPSIGVMRPKLPEIPRQDREDNNDWSWQLVTKWQNKAILLLSKIHQINKNVTRKEIMKLGNSSGSS